MGEDELGPEQLERYSRQIALAGVGRQGQAKLLGASVLVVGAGGLGSAALKYLAGAGVGRIGIADDDAVALCNLHRQVIHTAKDCGMNKAASAQAALRALNPDCKVEALQKRMTPETIGEAVSNYEIVLDCCDNFPTRFLITDYCRLHHVPVVSAAAIRFEGQLMTILPGLGMPCYRCFIPGPPPAEDVPKCAQVGIFGPVAGVLGTLQATEALKLILGVGEPLSNHVLIYDGLKCEFRKVKRLRDPHCALCGESANI